MIKMVAPFGPYLKPQDLGCHANQLSHLMALLVNAKSVLSKTTLIYDLTMDEAANLVYVNET